ncbi:MAG: hypothetical protein GX569_03540 [Candidatus Riflebacteria bacterium]|nr:hypothetical protein [Candidatus Riflebacteria bacterium]
MLLGDNDNQPVGKVINGGVRDRFTFLRVFLAGLLCVMFVSKPVAAELPWNEQVQIITDKMFAPEDETALAVTFNGVWSWSGGSDNLLPDKSEAIAVAGKKKIRNYSIVYTCRTTPQMLAALESGVDLRPAVTCDVYGNESLADWWYWEKEPVYMLSPNCPVFYEHLLDLAKKAVDHGVDCIYIDELPFLPMEISLKKGSVLFGKYDIAAFERNLERKGYSSFADYLAREYMNGRRITDRELKSLFSISQPDDFNVAVFLRAPAKRYAEIRQWVLDDYREFQAWNHFVKGVEYISAIRNYARKQGKDVKLSANTIPGAAGDGESCARTQVWNKYLDFMAFENQYNTPTRGEYIYPPQGKCGAYYRLGRSLTQGFVATVPGFGSNECFKGHDLSNFTALMFCEAFAYEGNWILGRFFEEEHDEIVEEMSIYTNFMLKNARYFEGQRKKNSVGVLYCDQGMLEDGDRHYSYLGLCQALAELNIQYDTIFTGNELFGFDDIDMGDPADYQAILLPMANSFTVAQTRTLAKLAATGRNIVIYGPDASQLPEAPNITRYGDLGLEFMNSFLDEQRDRIRKTLPASFKPLVEEVADSSVKAVFYEKEELECCVLHLINYDYVSESDMIKKKENLEVTLQLPSAYAAAKHALILAPGQEEVKIDLGRTGMQATFQVPGLETYALIVFNKP